MAAKLPPLEQVDPAEAWQSWQPTPSDPWGRKWAAHLYRRTAFGANRAELRQAERLGPQGTLDVLFRGSPQADEIVATLTDVGRIAAARDDGGAQLVGWWLYVMLQGGHPLREKLTLFWHNHFATSLAKVQQPGPDVPAEWPAAPARSRQVRPVFASDQPRWGHAGLAGLQQ